MMNQPRRGPVGGAPPPRDSRPPPPQLPEGYLREGYFDEKGNIRCDLISRMAEEVAERLGNAGVTSAQLRRFFGQVRVIERLLQQTTFGEVCPQILSLKAKAANYVGRGSSNEERSRREVFKRFIDQNVDLIIKSPEKGFNKGFVPHFESVVAYYKYHFPTR